MKKLVLFSSILAISFGSCKKEDSQIQGPAPSTYSPQDRTTSVLNPFENLGALHNEAMDYVGQSPNLGAMTRYQKYESVYNFNQTYYASTKMGTEEFSTFVGQIDLLVAAGKNAPAELYRNGKINQRMRGLLDTLYTILLETAEGGLPLDPVTMTGAVKTFEANVVLHYGMPDANTSVNTDIAMVMAGSAIARYSYAYWYNANINPTSPWHPIIKDDPLSRTWIGVALADIGDFFSSTCFYNDLSVWDLNCAWANGAEASASAK